MQETGQLSIVYTLTMDDLLAASLFQVRRSPTIRKMQRRNLLVSGLIVFTCVLVSAFTTPTTPLWFGLCVSSVCALLTVGFLRYFYQKGGYIKRVRKTMQQMHAENKHTGVLGQHTLEVDEEGINHVSAYSRTHYAWGALDRIETEPGYTYLFLGPQVFIIRHEAVSSGDFKSFLEQIGRHYQPGKTLASGLSSQA